MQMAISHLKTASFQGTLFIFFKQETDTARSSFPHYSCKRSVTSLFRGDRMAFSGSIKARERPRTRKRKKGRTEGLRGGKKERKRQNQGWTERETERKKPKRQITEKRRKEKRRDCRKRTTQKSVKINPTSVFHLLNSFII
jgi:hypothetical protein